MKSDSFKNTLLAAAAVVVSVAALAQNHGVPEAPAGKVIIGLVPVQAPAAQAGSGVDLSAPIQQSLINQLQGAGFDVVPLASRDGPQVDAEAVAKHANYVLYARVEQKHASGLGGIGGMLHKLAPLASMLPMAGGRGGGLAGAASTLAQGAAGATATAAQQQAMSQMAGAAAGTSGIKSGDTLSIEYRLAVPGSAAAVSSATLQGKARGDGEDLMSPLVGQLVSGVSTVMRTGASAGAPGAVSSQAGFQQVSTRQDRDSDAAQGKRSMLGGLFSRHDAAANRPSTNTGNGAIDCASIASMPNAPMTLDSCQKLQAAQQTYNQAQNDPSAARPGDEQMSCEQITAELKQQQYAALDKSKVASAQATVSQQQAMNKREYANMVKMQAEDQAAVNAASAADTATELSTGGLVRGRALEATEKALTARQNANNERVIKEGAPLARKSAADMADLGTTMAQQLQSNPRLGRLLQLANTRHCKGG